MDIASSFSDTRITLEQPTNVRWRIVGLLLAVSFMSWFNRVSMAVAYDEQIKNELGITETEMGAVYSAFLLAYTVFMTPGGWFADRLGPWLGLAIMGVGSGVLGACTGLPGFLALSAAQAFFTLLGFRTFMGVFTAPIYPASARVIAHWIPFSQRAMVNGLVMAAALVGISSTYHGFGMLLDNVRWQYAFLFTGTITTLLGLLWTWYGRNYPWHHPGVNQAERDWIRHEDRSSTHVTAQPSFVDESSWLRLLRNRSLILLTLSYAAVGYFEYLFYFWIHHYFEEVRQLGKDESRWYATITTLAMAAGMVVGGWLSDRLQRHIGYRWGRAIVPVAGMLIGAGLLFAGLAAEEAAWIVLWFGLAMAAVGATEGPFWATAIDLGGRHGATAAGIFNTGGNAGGAVAPILTPIVSELYGWEWGIALGSIVCLAGVAFWLWIDPAERTQ
jgi:sugar phosphate permease